MTSACTSLHQQVSIRRTDTAHCGHVLPTGATQHEEPPSGPLCEPCRLIFLESSAVSDSSRGGRGYCLMSPDPRSATVDPFRRPDGRPVPVTVGTVARMTNDGLLRGDPGDVFVKDAEGPVA
jgi:hypothetical protein